MVRAGGVGTKGGRQKQKGDDELIDRIKGFAISKSPLRALLKTAF